MPRKPKGFPYVRVNRQGRLQYYRRVPPDKRCFFQGRAAFTCVLDCDPSEPNGKAAYEAWSRANEEYEQRIAQEIAPDASETAIEAQQTPLSPRDASGIVAEPLRKLLEAIETGEGSAELDRAVVNTLGMARFAATQFRKTGDISVFEGFKGAVVLEFIEHLLADLKITLDESTFEQIHRRFFDYLPVLRKDIEKLEKGDYSPGELKRITPPLPQSRVTYDGLIEQWLKDAGGFRNEKGSGVDQKRYEAYWIAVRELIQITGKHFPSELTIDDVRGYINSIQASDKSISTNRARISTLTNLFAVGLRYRCFDTTSV